MKQKVQENRFLKLRQKFEDVEAYNRLYEAYQSLKKNENQFEKK